MIDVLQPSLVSFASELRQTWWIQMEEITHNIGSIAFFLICN
jgi:hypothetical protein